MYTRAKAYVAGLVTEYAAASMSPRRTRGRDALEVHDALAAAVDDMPTLSQDEADEEGSSAANVTLPHRTPPPTSTTPAVPDTNTTASRETTPTLDRLGPVDEEEEGVDGDENTPVQAAPVKGKSKKMAAAVAAAAAAAAQKTPRQAERRASARKQAGASKSGTEIEMALVQATRDMASGRAAVNDKLAAIELQQLTARHLADMESGTAAIEPDEIRDILQMHHLDGDENRPTLWQSLQHGSREARAEQARYILTTVVGRMEWDAELVAVLWKHYLNENIWAGHKEEWLREPGNFLSSVGNQNVAYGSIIMHTLNGGQRASYLKRINSLWGVGWMAAVPSEMQPMWSKGLLQWAATTACEHPSEQERDKVIAMWIQVVKERSSPEETTARGRRSATFKGQRTDGKLTIFDVQHVRTLLGGSNGDGKKSGRGRQRQQAAQHGQALPYEEEMTTLQLVQVNATAKKSVQEKQPEVTQPEVPQQGVKRKRGGEAQAQPEPKVQRQAQGQRRAAGRVEEEVPEGDDEAAEDVEEATAERAAAQTARPKRPSKQLRSLGRGPTLSATQVQEEAEDEEGDEGEEDTPAATAATTAAQQESDEDEDEDGTAECPWSDFLKTAFAAIDVLMEKDAQHLDKRCSRKAFLILHQTKIALQSAFHERHPG